METADGDRHMLKARIVPLSDAERALGMQEYWVPRREVVVPILGAVVRKLRADGDAQLAQVIAGYWQQYVGVVVDGRKLIQAFLACEVEPNWNQHLTVWLDGGRCFVDVTYDPEERRVLEVNIHGEA